MPLRRSAWQARRRGWEARAAKAEERQRYPIWKAFEREANAVWRNGRRHYSARTIGEYLRHETALREDGEWKITDMARLYGLMYPERGLFEFRGERKAA